MAEFGGHGGHVFYFGEIAKRKYVTTSVFMVYSLLYVVVYILDQHTHWHFYGAWVSEN